MAYGNMEMRDVFSALGRGQELQPGQESYFTENASLNDVSSLMHLGPEGYRLLRHIQVHSSSKGVRNLATAELASWAMPPISDSQVPENMPTRRPEMAYV